MREIIYDFTMHSLYYANLEINVSIFPIDTGIEKKCLSYFISNK